MTPRCVTFKGIADRQLGRLHPEMRTRVAAAIDRLAATGTGDVCRLTGRFPPQFRLRVGSMRVFFILPDDTTLRVTSIEKRGDAY